jgi:hypothetical protein
VRLPARTPIRELDLALSDAPAGVTLESVNETPDGVTLVLKAVDKGPPVGLRDNLIVEGFRRAARPAAAVAPARQARASAGFLPAIPFEVVRP